jgi:hypothetical protein
MKEKVAVAGAIGLAVGSVLVGLSAIASGFTLVERNAPRTLQKLLFHTIIVVAQPMMGDGSRTLAPGRYDVNVYQLGDDSVRAAFVQGGVLKGTIPGRLVRGASGGTAALHVNTAQVHPEQVGGRQVLQIGTPGGDRVLIGLLVPAVQVAHGAMRGSTAAIKFKGSAAAQKLNTAATPH